MEKGKILRAGKNEGKVVKKKKIRRVSSNYVAVTLGCRVSNLSTF